MERYPNLTESQKYNCLFFRQDGIVTHFLLKLVNQTNSSTTLPHKKKSKKHYRAS